ncbi:MAG: hypothetical protein M3Z84_07430 [Actinomycetota bacterium]|nr:hypothetical protein [Actinomycetota bacterium]
MQASVAGLAAVAVLGSCSRDSTRSAPGATVPTTARPTTTTDPYAVPAVIDVAYVNRVLGALDAAVGDITRMVIAERDISPAVQKQLRALYVGEYFDLAVKSYRQDIDRNFPGALPSPGNQVTAVSSLISATSACIFIEASRDFSGVSATPDTSLAKVWVALKHSAPADSSLNKTGWVYAYDGFTQDRTQPRDPCADS